jgi:hypothetical protein
MLCCLSHHFGDICLSGSLQEHLRMLFADWAGRVLSLGLTGWLEPVPMK